MYEKAKARQSNETETLQFVNVILPEGGWHGDAIVQVEDPEGQCGQFRVNQAVADALWRGATLMPLDLCRRIDVDVWENPHPKIGLEIVGVYWEA